RSTLFPYTTLFRSYPFNVYLSVRLIGTVLGVAAIAVMALALGYRGDLLSLVLVVAFAKAFEAVSDVVFGLLQKAENLRRVAISMLAKGVISVLAVGLVLRLTGDIVLNPRDGPLLGKPAGDVRPARRRPGHEPSADPGAS